jgi:hypothetical protein
VKLTANNKAVILYLLAVLVILGVWYILVFEGNPAGVNPIDNLLYFLNEPPTQLIFWWLLVFPVLCLLLAAAYFSKWSQTRMGAISLFGVGAVLALAAWWTTPSPVAVLVSLALWYGFVVLRPHLTLHSRGTR